MKSDHQMGTVSLSANSLCCLFVYKKCIPAISFTLYSLFSSIFRWELAVSETFGSQASSPYSIEIVLHTAGKSIPQNKLIYDIFYLFLGDNLIQSSSPPSRCKVDPGDENSVRYIVVHIALLRKKYITALEMESSFNNLAWNHFFTQQQQ